MFLVIGDEAGLVSCLKNVGSVQHENNAWLDELLADVPSFFLDKVDVPSYSVPVAANHTYF
jgi:hypothetical protein